MNTTDDIDLYRTFWVSSAPGSVTGPFTLEQIGGMWRAGQIYATAQICEEGASDWQPVTTLRRDFPEIMSTGMRSAPATIVSDRPALPVTHPGTYRVLAILLGHIGVHNFFAGEVAAGIWKIGLMGLGLMLIWSGVSVFLVFGAIFWLGLGAWIVYDLIRGPLDPNDAGQRYEAPAKDPAERVKARQPVMYVALTVLVFFLIWRLMLSL